MIIKQLLLLLLLLIISLCIKIIFVIIIITIIIIIVIIIIIKFCVAIICFVFDEAKLWRGLEVWQISSEVKNKRNGGSHEVDEIDNTFIYIYTYLLFIYLFVCLFLYLFVCLFIYLFVISFILLKLRWIYSAKRESFRQVG